MPDSDPGSPDLAGSPLQINTDRDGDSITIALTGELDFKSTPDVERAIRDAEETEVGHVVVDLSELWFIDSTGLSVLLNARKRNNGRLRCIPSAHDSVAQLLALTGTTEFLS